MISPKIELTSISSGKSDDVESREVFPGRDDSDEPLQEEQPQDLK